jgi:hypothetical protein
MCEDVNNYNLVFNEEQVNIENRTRRSSYNL